MLRDTLPSFFEGNPEHYVPLRVGSSVIGWMPTLDALVDGHDELDVTVVVHGEKISRVPNSLLWGATQPEVLGGYEGGIILNFPPNALPLKETGTVDSYSDDFNDPMYYSMANYTIAFQNNLQSELHKLDPKSVMAVLRTLRNRRYPLPMFSKLTWRGMSLDALVRNSSGFIARANHDGRFVMECNPVGGESKGIADFFAMQTTWMTLPNGNFGMDYTPANTFAITVSPNKFEAGKLILTSQALLKLRSEIEQGRIPNVSPDFNSRVDTKFFLMQDDDPLLPWLMGQQISFDELCNGAF